MRDYFSKYGKVNKCSVLYVSYQLWNYCAIFFCSLQNLRTGYSKECAVIKMTSSLENERLIRAKTHSIDGRQCVVDLAREKNQQPQAQAQHSTSTGNN